MAAFLLTADDRERCKALYNVDHLLELWDEIGTPSTDTPGSGSSGARASGSATGRRPRRHRALRALPRGRHSPDRRTSTSPYTRERRTRGSRRPRSRVHRARRADGLVRLRGHRGLRETGAGVLVKTPREFVDAVVHLVEDAAARRVVAAAAKRAGRATSTGTCLRDGTRTRSSIAISRSRFHRTVRAASPRQHRQ